MTDEELKALVARNSEAVAENSRAIREMREASEVSEKRFEAHQKASEKRFEAHQKASERGKKLFGVVAAMQIPDDMRTRVLKEGFYLATIRDDVFEIAPPDGFEPHVFGLRGLG